MIGYIRVILFFAACLISFSGHAGVTIGGTRLIYHAEESETPLSVYNTKDSVPYLIQSWIESNDKNSTNVPFVVTPPLFRLDGGHENTLRVVFMDDLNLPQDRESLFWLNIKSIPSMEKLEKNRLLIAVKSRLKLFYRPAHLKKEQENEPWKFLKFFTKKNVVIITNPTPYYISLYSLRIGAINVKEPPMISPFDSVTIAASGKRVFWKAINDFGGITQEITQSLP